MADVDERLWVGRARWWLRGNWQAPGFVLAVLAGALLLDLLPVQGDQGVDLVGGTLLCGFLALAVVALLAPLVARAWGLRHPHGRLPVHVVQDRVACTLLAAGVLLLLGLGIGHHGAVAAAGDDYDVQLAAARAWVGHHAPAEYRAGLGRESVWKQADGLYRTCVPGHDPERDLCLIVETDNGQPTVARDPSQEPNSRVAGVDNPGREGS